MSKHSSSEDSPTRRVKVEEKPKVNPPEQPAPPKSRSMIPEWASKAASQKRSWKLLARCWVASWVCFILILPNKTLAAMGNALVVIHTYSFGLGLTLVQRLFCFDCKLYCTACYAFADLFLCYAYAHDRVSARLGVGKRRDGGCPVCS